MKAENDDGILNPEYLQQYAIVDKEGEFEKALQNGGVKVSASGIVSVKSNRKKMGKLGASQETNKSKRKGKDGEKPKSNKKKRT